MTTFLPSAVDPRNVRRFGLALTAVLLGMLAVIVTVDTTAAAPAPISGTVTRDYDHDGIADGDEPGVAGVGVTATAPDGSTTTATTDANGDYTLVGLDDTLTYRVEFDWSEEWLASGPMGAGNDSSVQFVSGGATVDFAVASADDFCEVADASLNFVTTCFVNGDPVDGSDYDYEHTVVAIPGTATGIAMDAGASPVMPDIYADNTDVGSTYGLAHERSTGRLFSAAFLKRHVGLGVGGIDAIYEIDSTTGSVNGSVWYDAIDAGTVDTNAVRGMPTSSAAPSSTDAAAFAQIYKVGWGDIDLSPDESTLYAVNLFDRSIYAIDVAAADAGSTTAHANLGRPTAASCPNGVARLFGIEIHDGTLWAGVTCTAESGGTTADLSAEVWGYDLSTGTWAGTPALQFPLDYTQGCILMGGGCGPYEPWIDTFSYAEFNFSENTSNPYEAPLRPQPVVSDLEIDRNGVMIVAIRDRQGDQFGFRNETPDGSGNLVTGMSSGDLLGASPDGDGTWTIESSGQIGSLLTSTGTGTTQRGAGGTAAAQGPGGGEFYWDDFAESGGQVWHSETILGSLALAPGRDDVAVTNFDPLTNRLDSAGVTWFTNATGARDNAYELYRSAGAVAETTSGKANGLGDIEAMCPAAPVQIGNRVWFDADDDGVQDPDEPAIPGVSVALSDGQTTTTDADGVWAFTVAPNTALTVTLDPSTANVSGLTGVGSAADLLPTSMDLGGSDTVDSDMDPADLTIDVVSGAPGQNDHTLDAGFNVAATTHEIGNLVWFDADNDGVATAGEPGIPGVTVELLEGGAVIATTTTDADGHYNFSGLDAGTYQVRIPAQAGAGQPLAGYLSSTPTDADADNDDDNDDNGIDPASSSDPILSGSVVITTGAEPTDEALRSGSATADESTTGTADANSNLSVDFGFYRLASLGDVVWIDENGNGQQDPGEPGVPNVTVNLCDANGDVIATTVTAADGSYIFDGLAPGDYCVCFDLTTLPEGYEPTTSDLGDDATDSDVDPATGCTPITTLDAGEHDPTLDLGIVAIPSSLGDFVWIDSDLDGVQDAGETPVPNVTVELRDANGATIATTTTDTDGSYIFDGLTPGVDYAVCFDLTTLPDGYEPTWEDLTGDAIDSDADRATGCVPVVALAPGQHDPTLDLGVVPLGSQQPLAVTGSNTSLSLLGGGFLLAGLGTALLALRRSLAFR